MENNEDLKTEVSQAEETTEQKTNRPKNPRVLVKGEVLKRGETWLFVEQGSEWFKTGYYEDGALFLININKKNEKAKDIKEGRTYEFLLDITADLNRKTKKIECKYWLNSFRQTEF